MLEEFEKHLQKNTNLDANAIKQIGKHFILKTTSRNEILVDYSSVCEDFYFINKGILRIFNINSEGMETSRFFAFENMFCTVLPSFIDQKPACVYLQSIEKSILLVCRREDFYNLI
ncbi:Crp/Fnr family transcriptional regulator [Gillisia sp. JM1]|uniref:Crp/Fnr family transcriptional regulator n=1 Tax=Gillisia sp. JM1 TaxID=1283286 RepID=UPI000425D36C|nr:cyclic nucleotide-binding domain-containing protein [Gillisia sp. JM1]